MIEKLNLPQDMQQAIRRHHQQNPKYFDRQAAIAYSGECPDYPIVKRSPLERAVILCCCLETLYTRYQATGLSEEIIWGTFSDISLRLRLYEKKHGKIGLTKEDVIWFRHIWNCEIFQIGSLQYHRFHMRYLDREGYGEDYMEFSPQQKENLPQGTPVWNVHIPRGTDLRAAMVAESMSKAEWLLPMLFPEHQAACFLCYSWLLYPGLKNLLPESSNIRSFAQRFTIIGTVQDPQEAIGNLYGRRYPRKAQYPQNTALQRAALGHFSQLGYACGIIPLQRKE